METLFKLLDFWFRAGTNVCSGEWKHEQSRKDTVLSLWEVVPVSNGVKLGARGGERRSTACDRPAAPVGQRVFMIQGIFLFAEVDYLYLNKLD